jgi:hypothetical protein
MRVVVATTSLAGGMAVGPVSIADFRQLICLRWVFFLCDQYQNDDSSFSFFCLLFLLGVVWVVWATLIVVFIHTMGIVWLTYKSEAIKSDINQILSTKLSSRRKKSNDDNANASQSDDVPLATVTKSTAKDPDAAWKAKLDRRLDLLAASIDQLAGERATASFTNGASSKKAKRSSKRGEPL